MSFQSKLKKTLDQLPEHFPKGADLLKHFSEQVQGYEEHLKTLVSELDTKSRNAREKSQARLNHLLDQAKTTRKDLEKKVTKLVDAEKKRLNTNLNDFVSFLKSVSGKEKTPAKRKKTTVAKKATSSKKKTAGKRTAQSKSMSSSAVHA